MKCKYVVETAYPELLLLTSKFSLGKGKMYPVQLKQHTIYYYYF